MNKIRRQKLDRANNILSKTIDGLRTALDLVVSCNEEEEGSLYNIPENLSGSDRYLSMEDNIDKMNDAIYSIKEAMGYLDGI